MNAPVLAAELKSSTAVPSPIPSNAGPSIRARIVERRTYLRPKDEDGKRFETPKEAKDRVIGHQRWLWENAVKRPLNEAEEAELAELRSLMDQSKISVSGRVKWMGGTDIIKERASAAFNCSFTILETPADFVDAFWLLLQGCGVGFKPKPGLLTGFPSTLLKIEVIPSTRTERGGAEDNSETVEDGVWTIKFGDSAKAWSKAIGKFLAEKHRVHTLRLDYSELRPGGKRLRGYGWLSSGWKPLADGFTKIAQVMMRYADQPLDAVAILDIMNTLGTVLSSRRSAQIGLLEETHRDISAFVGAKAGEWYLTEAQRSQSNNSIMFTSKPSREKIVELLHQIYRTGEPGFVNLEAGRRRAPEMEGFNPCAEILLPSKGFCVEENTPLLTRDQGLQRIGDLVGKSVEVWNGEEWSAVEPYQTGEAVTLFEVRANDGSILRATANHRWQVWVKDRSESWRAAREMEVTTLGLVDLLKKPHLVVRLPDTTVDYDGGRDVDLAEAYTLGVMFGDGCAAGYNGNPCVDLYRDKVELPILGRRSSERANGNGTPYVRVSGMPFSTEQIERVKADISEVFTWSRAAILHFLAGALDTDGSETDSGGVRLYVSGRAMAEQFQLLFRLVGIRASICVMSRKGDMTNFGARKADMYYLSVTDCAELPCHRLDVSRGHKPTRKGAYQIILEVEQMEGLHPSYCFTEPKRGMGLFGNMLTYQCNLMQVVWHRYNGDFEGLKRAQYLAGRANYRQTVVSMRDGVLQLQWDDQQKLLRLCGVSPTGYVSWEYADSPSHLEIVADAARRGANAMADDLGLQRARRVTQCQPAGTSSKVLGLEGDEVHEGAHAAMSRYIFNNIQFNKLDPLVEKLREANYHVFDHPSDPTGVIAAIPVEYPASPVFTKVVKQVPFDKMIRRRDETTHETAARMPEAWTEDGVIVTKDEVPEGIVYKAWREEELEVNVESAIRQLERYRILMNHYIDHNCSITVSFDETEIEEMADWFMEHWDSYIGVSFLQRNDPTKSALELGFQYLPQQAVSKRVYDAYVKTLLPVDLTDDEGEDMVALEDCATGACPIR